MSKIPPAAVVKFIDNFTLY